MIINQFSTQFNSFEVENSTSEGFLMSNDLMKELRDFLANADLSTYCMNAYISLMDSVQLTAKEITKKSGVPIGRIYEVLDELEAKGMIFIHDSRPKAYSVIPLNQAIYNLISYQTKESKRKASYLYETAQILESKFHDSELKSKITPTKVFYSAIFGTKEIIPIYLQYFNEAQEELLLSEFINEKTPKVFSIAKDFFTSLSTALDRGVEIKILISFEYNNIRPLSKEIQGKNKALLDIITKQYSEYGLSTDKDGFKVKYVPRSLPTYFDVLDRQRVILKLKNPSNPWQIFTTLNIIDPLLATELRKKFFNVWNFDAIDLHTE